MIARTLSRSPSGAACSRPEPARRRRVPCARRPALGVLALVLAAWCVPGRAVALERHQRLEQLHHTAWTPRDGLTGSALCLAQTADGHLWIGTSDGLFRFDGVQFERFTPLSGGLPRVSVSSLLALPDGGLWVGYTRGGASFIDRHGRTTDYAFDRNGLPFGRVGSFARDHDGTVWTLATGGIARFERGGWRRLPLDLGFSSKTAHAFFVDREGTLWVGAATPDRILYLAKGTGKFQDTGLPTSSTVLGQTAAGTLVFADIRDDLIYAMPPRGSTAGAPRLVVDHRSQAITLDRDGNLWVGGIGLARMPSGTPQARGAAGGLAVERFGRADGLSGSVVSDLLEDREGNMWVTTEGGLDRFRRRNVRWERHRPAAGDAALVPGNNGDIWALSGWEPRLLRIRDGAVQRDAPKHLMGGYRDDDGTIWLAAAGAFWRWRDGRFWAVTPPEVVRTRRFPFTVRAIARDRHGRLWASINGLGQFYVKDGHWTFVEVLPGRGDLTATAAITDAAGRVWLVYHDALALVDADHIRVFEGDDAPRIGTMLTLAADGRHVWAGGESGLAFFDGDRFHTVRAAGPGFGLVTGIVVSRHGLWFAASAGVIHIPQPEVDELLRDPARPVRYEAIDLVTDLPEPLQFRDSGASFGSAAADADGVIWFVTARGVVGVDPSRMARNPLRPPVVIRSVVADDRAYSPRTEVTLPPLTRTIRIDYTALSLTIPERVKFRYRLKGWETDWHDAGTRRSVFYTDLRPGTYGFQVIACNNDGVWNEEGAAFAFSVAPAWYQTAWFRSLAVAGGIGLVLAAYRVRMRQVSAALSARFDARLAERVRIARDLHDTLLQTVQASKLVADDALERAGDAEGVRRAVERLSEWLGRAVQEGRAALHSLRASGSEVTDLAKAFSDAAENAPKPPSMTCAVRVRGDRPVHPVVCGEVYRIGYEAIRNACAHSNGTRLDVAIEYGQDLSLRVSDDGVGIDAAVAADGKRDRYGLAGMRERAAAIGATLTALSSPAGTSVVLVVPGRIAFRPDAHAAPSARPGSAL